MCTRGTSSSAMSTTCTFGTSLHHSMFHCSHINHTLGKSWSHTSHVWLPCRWIPQWSLQQTQSQLCSCCVLSRMHAESHTSWCVCPFKKHQVQVATSQLWTLNRPRHSAAAGVEMEIGSSTSYSMLHHKQSSFTYFGTQTHTRNLSILSLAFKGSTPHATQPGFTRGVQPTQLLV